MLIFFELGIMIISIHFIIIKTNYMTTLNCKIKITYFIDEIKIIIFQKLHAMID